MAKVVNSLNGRGFKNKSWVSKRGNPKGGQPFNIDAIWRILNHYGYIGQREINKNNKNSDQDLLKEEEKYSIVKASWDSIIDDETFRRVQSKLAINKKKKHPDGYDFILSGVLVCDECGNALSGQSATGRVRKHRYYGHNKKTSCQIQRYNAEELERLVKKWMFSLLNHQELKEQFVVTLLDEVKKQPELLKSLLNAQKGEVSKLRVELDRLASLIVDNPLAKESHTLLTKIQEKEDQLKQAKEAEEKLKERASLKLGSETIDLEFVLEGIDKLRKDNFRKARASNKKAIIQGVIKSIHIHPKNALKVDIWANRFQAEDERKKARQEKGVVLPFRELGRPLVASYIMGAAKGGKYSEIREKAGMGLSVLYSASHSTGKPQGYVGSCIETGSERGT